ncbi:phytoene desaturase, pro-zeta-carotene producing [Piscinibacter sakaiensis]|uniref:Phytoene desaturase, pro-zeta-carotene producing n=2 Tax=Piscinibacter sakaiensis TaxID=1547922 RepID=A0A0K8NYY9_PISS1|nr:hydroxysqualene dehydroxylase HpnE [Piscinibacter sakaiensis]GAP35596.1 phytoene desaturase, pro-zeta-carotene producing [Piscinibacter sakaiensis]
MGRVAVIGAGWAGLAAAVEASSHGAEVTLYEMAARAGGRARTVPGAATEPLGPGPDGEDATARTPDDPDADLDNGQHILIGAYRETLDLMQRVGADPQALLLRRPLALVPAEGPGLVLRPGPPVAAFVRAVLAHRGWGWAERLALLRAALRWRLAGFRCDPGLDVARLTAALPARVRQELIDPLCVAALNTPSEAASAAVFLRVLGDALFSGPGGSDLLLPRRRLGALLPEPALQWLAGQGARLRLGRRVHGLQPGRGAAAGGSPGWLLDDEALPHDQVLIATPATEAARLVAPWAPDWAARAAALRHEPIMTFYLHADGAQLRAPMLALAGDAQQRPGQFLFDLGALDGRTGLLALVVSGASPWVARDRQAGWAAALAQVREVLAPEAAAVLRPVRLIIEKRATLWCTPGLVRPPMRILPGLLAAGDHVDGPYPSTLEGAVRSGLAAARAAAQDQAGLVSAGAASSTGQSRM